MKILVLGATGSVGRRLVAEGLKRGHHITALVRNPSKVQQQSPNLRVVSGNVLDDASVARALEGQDAVAYSIGVANRPHWHIDYLRSHTILEQVWSCYGRKRREHLWARRFAALPGATVPMEGFGSSDCNRESHLFFFKERPRLTCLKNAHITEIALLC